MASCFFERIQVAVAFFGGDFEADVQELAEAGIVRWIFLVVAQGGDELSGGPAVHGGGAGEFRFVDVDDAGVGGAEFIHVVHGVGVNFFGDFQTVAAGFGEADEFFEPGGARSFDVDAGVEFLQGAAHGLVEGKFIAAGMDAQFEARGQAVFLDGKGDDGEVFVKFFFELFQVANVIDAFVEAAGEFGRDGLEWNFLRGQSSEDDEQFGRRLRAVGFIHGNFSDEIFRALRFDDVLINFSGVLCGEQKFVGDAFDFGAGDGERMVDVRDGDGADEFGMGVDEGFHVRGDGGFADAVGDVDGEEIGRRDKTIDGFEANVVGIDVVGLFPAEGFDGGVGFGAEARRFGADEGVFAVGFVPDGNEVRAEFGGELAGAELGFSLVSEAVTHAEGEFSEGEILVHKILLVKTR